MCFILQQPWDDHHKRPCPSWLHSKVNVPLLPQTHLSWLESGEYIFDKYLLSLPQFSSRRELCLLGMPLFPDTCPRRLQDKSHSTGIKHSQWVASCETSGGHNRFSNPSVEKNRLWGGQHWTPWAGVFGSWKSVATKFVATDLIFLNKNEIPL